MPITFLTISASLRTPGAFSEFDNSRAVSVPPAVPKVALILAPKTSAGTATANVPVQVTSTGDAQTKLGIPSFGAAMVAAYLKNNLTSPLFVIPIADAGGGTQAQETLTITGTATAAGSIFLWIDGVLYTTGVSVGDVQNTQATNVAATVNAIPTAPFTAAAVANVVTFTCVHKGTLGNKIDFRLNYALGQTLPAGVTAVLAQSVAGATDPSIATAVANMGTTKYYSVTNPFRDSTNYGLLNTQLQTNLGAMINAYGQQFISINDTYSNTATFGQTLNSNTAVCIMSSGSPVSEMEWAAATAGARDVQPQPNLPYQGVPLFGVLAPAAAALFPQPEQNTLLFDGVSTFTVDSGGQVRLQRLITTYQKNPAGSPDPSYLDIMTLDTLDYLRFAISFMIQSKFPRNTLADDATVVQPGSNAVRPKDIKAQLVDLFVNQWNGVYTQGAAQFISQLIVQRNASDPNRVDCQMGPNLLGAFMVFANQIEFILGTHA